MDQFIAGWFCLLYFRGKGLFDRDHSERASFQPVDHVSNPDGIITPDDASRINQLLNVVEDSLGIEVAVVAVNSIGDQDARMFATDLFKHWGLGQKSKDNGLLIQLVTEPSQRSVVFETGYGIEGVLPDAICYRSSSGI